jgi:hypothetical protein
VLFGGAVAPDTEGELSTIAEMMTKYGIGVIEGGKEKTLAIARALKAKGIPDKVIAETTGLTLGECAALT